MAGHLGRRLRRGATSGAVVAAAVAALAASQGPGTTQPPTDGASGDVPIGTGDTATTPDGSASGDSPYYTELPPLNTPNKPGSPAGTLPVITGPAEAGIPASVLAAYQRAEQSIRSTDPDCNLPWQLLAGIGKVESGQARGGAVDANGTTNSPILGPVLNGVGFANISDTDDGAYDGDSVHDRAVGPMQFIPSTWATWGQDANGDGKKDPNNIYDAAQAAGLYLCANGRNLAVKADLDKAILSYNRSREYLNTVLSWFEYYKRGSHQVPDGTGVLPGDRSDNPRTTPGARPTPTAPVTPKPKPTTPKPSPSKPAEPTPTKPTTPPTTDPAAKVARLNKDGATALSATAGTTFTTRPTVLAVDLAGKPVAGVQVRFRISDETDARFAVGAREVTAVTGSNGKAVAPTLKAGEQTGGFKVSATVVGRALNAVEFAATVTERSADTLTHVDAKELAATTGGTVTGPVTVKATDGGAAAAGVALTATFVTSATDPQPATDGPYFKDADGTAVRTLTGLKTRADGTYELPDIHAGDKTGTFVLRLTAPGGGSVTITITVTAPEPEPEPTPTPSPSSSTGGTPEPTPTS
ncbi:lytic transglycosylase domain-containing protein [Streptomyces roseicoloratus]|uniref:Lytic transglycosylase domain-containing protein n=1 Tax=Streptomyces roseicoloratus TaxID=2508722 RepID=A0ABY9S0Y2_9ACTN|nr:lytic transglycosylase domain-containing protein [Streptomyces roseicoloratus]WMX47593.1 lytic transglycosylase domain-containing protein [Streptomyces roseicoloratus]